MRATKSGWIRILNFERCKHTGCQNDKISLQVDLKHKGILKVGIDVLEESGCISPIGSFEMDFCEG